MSENEAILSADEVYNADWDSKERDAVVASHEALRKERDEYRMAAGAEADHADEQRARAAHWYTQAAEQEDRARAEINRLDEALVAMANRAAAAEALVEKYKADPLWNVHEIETEPIDWDATP